MPELTTYPDPDAFLNVVQGVLERREAENSLMLGVTLGMRGLPPATASTPVLISVQTDASWSLAGVMTPPHPLVLAVSSHHVPSEDIALLVAHLMENELTVSGVVAAPAVAEAFAAAWTAASGGEVRKTFRHRIYSLREVADVPTVAGRLRRAVPDDEDLVCRWLAEFEREALNGVDTNSAKARARQRISDGDVYLWEAESHARSMAARARPTRNTITVNAAYTPLDWRRQGFATAVVAQLSRELLAEGFPMCVLYADLSNPTTNSIYQRIGYRPVSDSQHILLLDRIGG